MQTIPILATPAAALSVHALVAANGVPRACYGICCPIRRSCGLYHALDLVDEGDLVIDWCGPEHSAFEAVLPGAFL